MENFIGNWWLGVEYDVIFVGVVVDGYKLLNMNCVGDLLVFVEIQMYVYDVGNVVGDGLNFGLVLYICGMYVVMLVVEVIVKVQEIYGVVDVIFVMVCDGMEVFSIINVCMEELGMVGVGLEFLVSCQNYGGFGFGIVQQWDVSVGLWVVLIDYIEVNNVVIGLLIVEDLVVFVVENNIIFGCL